MMRVRVSDLFKNSICKQSIELYLKPMRVYNTIYCNMVIGEGDTSCKDERNEGTTCMRTHEASEGRLLF